jgi:hypothetical protein
MLFVGRYGGEKGMLEGKKAPEKKVQDSPVPEALGRLLMLLGKRVEVETMDRIWIFPPLVRGRKEWGLVAASFQAEDPALRNIVTGRYAAELTGHGMKFEPEFMSEGVAPPERLPSVMDGVVRRSDLQLGVAREEVIAGDVDSFDKLLLEYGNGPQAADPGAQ